MAKKKPTDKITFWDIIEQTIEKAETPLSSKEIWEKAHKLGTIGNFTTSGKTPWATIAAYCYTDINRAGESSTIIQTSERPAQFFLRKLITKIDGSGLNQGESFIFGYGLHAACLRQMRQ